MGLEEELLRSMQDAGYEQPFPIQEMSIPVIMTGRDVIGQAKTGSGKTAAFGLPILHHVSPESNWIQALILAPTRELALQITEELRKLSRYKNTSILTIYGGQSIALQLERLSKRVNIVVGTPGRVIDFIKRRRLDLSKVRYVVLDEADRMLDMGFREDIEYILRTLPSKRQTSLFSATMPREIIELSRRYMFNPEKILIDSDEPSVEELEQYYTFADDGDKMSRLVELLKKENPSSAIIFCRTKAGARKLAVQLERRYFSVAALHGDLSQSQRDRAMQDFRDGRVDILVATDVAARGIDVPGVQMVINYDFPEDPLIYFHRVGRTARAGVKGKSYAILEYRDLSDFYRAKNLTKAKIKPLSREDEMMISTRRPEGYRRQTFGYNFNSRYRGNYSRQS